MGGFCLRASYPKLTTSTPPHTIPTVTTNQQAVCTKTTCLGIKTMDCRIGRQQQRKVQDRAVYKPSPCYHTNNLKPTQLNMSSSQSPHPLASQSEEHSTPLTNPKPPLPSPFSLTVHPIPTPQHPSSTYTCAYQLGDPDAPNALLFLGGLTSGPQTSISLLADLLAALEDAALGYSVWEVRTQSAYAGWGFGSLGQEAEDVEGCVRYLREEVVGREGKVVVMGSSSGELVASYCRFIQRAKRPVENKSTYNGDGRNPRLSPHRVTQY